MLKNFKRKIRFTSLGIVAMTGSLLVGCAQMNETQKSSAIGAGLGALAGAAIGQDGKGAAIGAGVGALGGYVWSKHMEQKKAAMEQATAGTGATVTQTADNQLKLNIPSDISFDSGRADIKANLRPVLDQFASGLGSQTNMSVTVIGHTDSVGGDAANNALSINRANSVRDYLVTRGVGSSRITTAGRGEREPVSDNSSEIGRAKNRRVEIFLAERASGQ